VKWKHIKIVPLARAFMENRPNIFQYAKFPMTFFRYLPKKTRDYLPEIFSDDLFLSIDLIPKISHFKPNF